VLDSGGAAGGGSGGGGLPALAGALLRLVGAGAAPPGQGVAAASVDGAALALLDVAKTCVYRVTTTFGPVLRGPVREAAAAAARRGTPGAAGAAEALDGFLRMEE
jgi:hypothetical protein